MRRTDDEAVGRAGLGPGRREVAATVEALRAGREIVSEPQKRRGDPGRIVAEFRDSEGNRMVLGSP